MDDLPILEGPGVRLRPCSPADFPALLLILNDPSVSRWWGVYDAARVAEDFADEDKSGVFIIEVPGALAGFVQFVEETDPMYRHASVDIALASSHQARGYGPTAVRILVRYLFDVRKHHRLTIDPAVANENAIRAYARVGFQRVGVMRKYERGNDGNWHDGLLMDLLADELIG